MGETTLDRLPFGCRAVVCAVDAPMRDLRRLLDLGLIDGTEIEPVLSSPSGNPRAYRFRGAVIALRNVDAHVVRVRPIGSLFQNHGDQSLCIGC